ncbi:MAG: carbohydrate binding domain-containing protein [Henriciella sp.]
MRVFKTIAAIACMAAATTMTQSVSADPNFEVAPVTRASVPGKLIHNPMAIKWQPEGSNKRVSIVDSEGVPGLQAIEFQVKRKNKRKPWDIRIRAPFDKSVSSDEAIEIYFWARASKLPKGQDAGKISVMLGRDEEPYDTVIDQQIEPTGEWKMYKVAGTAQNDFPITESEMGFNMGFEKQTIELGPFFAVTLGANAE